MGYDVFLRSPIQHQHSRFSGNLTLGGNLIAEGSLSKIGLNADGVTTGAALQVDTSTVLGDVLLSTVSSATNANVIVRPKGSGSFYVQNAAGTVNAVTVDTTAAGTVTLVATVFNAGGNLGSGTFSGTPTFSGIPVFSAGIDLGGWTDYTPTITPAGSMTMVSFGVDPSAFARYKVVGKICFVEINLGFTYGGTLSNSFTVSLPQTAARSGGTMTAIVQNLAGIGNITSTTVVSCFFYNQATLGSGNFYVKVTGFYELP